MIKNNLARFARRLAPFILNHTRSFRVIAGVSWLLAVASLVLGREVEGAALAVIGADFFIGAALIEVFQRFAGNTTTVVHHHHHECRDDSDGDDSEDDVDEEPLEDEYERGTIDPNDDDAAEEHDRRGVN
jgi:hypothetical protein